MRRRPLEAAMAALSDSRFLVPVTRGGDLCEVQAATRRLGRSAGLDEAAVFDAVIAVSELAHRLLVEAPAPGEVELAVVGCGRRRGLRARVASAAGPSASLAFDAGRRLN